MKIEKIIQVFKKLKTTPKTPIELIVEDRDFKMRITISSKKPEKENGKKIEKAEEIFYSRIIGKVEKILAKKSNEYSSKEVVIKLFQPLVGEEKILMPEDGEIIEIFVEEGEIIDWGKSLFSWKKLKKAESI